MKGCVSIFLFILTFQLAGQNKILDSLWKQYRLPNQADTQRLKVMANISHHYAFINPDTGKIIAQSVIKEAKEKKLIRNLVVGYNSLGVNFMYMDSIEKSLEALNACYDNAQKINDKSKMASALMNMGLAYDRKADHYKALGFKLMGLKLREQSGDKKALGNAYANLGISYADLCDYPKAIEYYLKSQKMAEETGDGNLLANDLNNIGLVYQMMGQHKIALDFYLKSIRLKEELGNKRSLCSSLGNAGFMYIQLSDYSTALQFYERGYKIQQEIGNRSGIANSLSNIGAYYQDLPQPEMAKIGMTREEKYTRAIAYHLQALKINEELEDLHSITIDLNNLGSAYYETGKYEKALAIMERAVKIARDINEIDREAYSLGILAKVYEKTGQTAKAYTAFKRHVLLHDSIINQENKSEITRKQLQSDYERRTTADSVKNAEAQKVKDAEIVAQQAQLKQEKTQRYTLYGGVLLLLGFGIFAYNRFRITQKQKAIIEKQKHLVEEKQKEILDSIHYARNIQRSLLPTDRYIQRTLERIKKS